jgi:anion-transporting  ArsA/GET3 family ATPase
VRELTMMGKIFHDIERRPASEPQWNLIIFDPPASGQALSMIRMPFAARETFGESVVGREAENVAAFLRNQNICAMVEVTTAEPLAITETLELHRELGKLGLMTAAAVFNRMSPASFDSVDIARLLRRGARDANLRHVDDLAEIARGELKRRARERKAIGILQRQIGSPLIKLQERRGLEDRTLVEALIAQLSARDLERDWQGAAGPPVN